MTSDTLGDDLLYLTDDELDHLTDEELADYLSLLGEVQIGEEGWNLQPRQQHAEDRCNELMAQGETFELLYGGAAAGGKSEWLLWHLHNLAMRFPGFKGLLIRRTFGELEKTAILRSRARFDRKEATYQTALKRWTFNNNSIIEFGYCESDNDVYQYDSAEYDCIAWDELTQFPTDYPYRYLFSRLRTSTALAVRGLTPHVIGGTNPHRTGVAWVKPRWVDIGRWGEVHWITTEFEDGTSRRIARVFVPARMDDNRYVNRPAYQAALSMLPEAIRRAMEEGSWDVVEGQYFPEWNRQLHVIRPFEIPQWWRRIGGLDFGYANPFAHEWIAFDPDGNAYVYREAYRRELTPTEQAKLILDHERRAAEKIDYRVADPSVWTRTGAGPPIAQQYTDAGMPCRKANNARIDGWQRLRDYLRPSVRHVDADSGAITFKPRLFIFDTCSDLTRTLPLLVHDRTNPEDCDTDGEDHAPDALRYALMSRPLRSLEPQEQVRPRDDVVRVPKRGRSGDAYDHPILGRMPR